MGNPFFNAMGGNAQIGGPFGNIQNFMQQLNQFKNTFKGNPQEEIEKMLQNGKITQEQYNQAAQMATQIMNMMGNG